MFFFKWTLYKTLPNSNPEFQIKIVTSQNFPYLIECIPRLFSSTSDFSSDPNCAPSYLNVSTFYKRIPLICILGGLVVLAIIIIFVSFSFDDNSIFSIDRSENILSFICVLLEFHPEIISILPYPKILALSSEFICACVISLSLSLSSLKQYLYWRIS